MFCLFRLLLLLSMPHCTVGRCASTAFPAISTWVMRGSDGPEHIYYYRWKRQSFLNRVSCFPVQHDMVLKYCIDSREPFYYSWAFLLKYMLTNTRALQFKGLCLFDNVTAAHNVQQLFLCKISYVITSWWSRHLLSDRLLGWYRNSPSLLPTVAALQRSNSHCCALRLCTSF